MKTPSHPDISSADDKARKDDGAELDRVQSLKPGLVMPAGAVEHHEANLKRSLAQRHLMMMVIGGVIGPGYFVGMGNGLSGAGPAGLLLCFAVVGTVLWAVMQSLGELGAFIPVSGSFVHYAARFIDPAVGFSLGWNYWFLRAGIVMAEYMCSRSGFMAFQFLGIGSFGDAEFWLALVKVIAIAVFFLCAILITTGVIGDQKIGFKYYHDPGAFADGPKGVFKIFAFAALQYSGSEMVGFTAGESRNPARHVPKAVRSVLWRIVFIFLGGIFFLTLTVPYDDENLLSGSSKTARSPFVIAFTRVGAIAGAHAVNAVIVITILSAVNSALYVGSRTLVGLASQGQAPKVFAWTNNKGVPVYSLIFMNLIGFLSLLNLSSGAGKLYTWIVSMTGVATFLTWTCICLSQIRFRQVMHQQGVSEQVLSFKTSRWVSWFGLCANLFFVVFQGWTSFAPWNVESFFMNYVIIIVFVLLYAGWKIRHKTRLVNPKEADLLSYRRDLLSDSSLGGDQEASSR
ncbi:hypothetical protein FZEAL_4081 [Fusarium zealandicum]|uniref:Amino acid permease/ SLC12A domain-containing protein n=1 Tax=Fusarium zealandicum TaxID=1053134 RepID=A0A8H4XLT4_9HYPO|nr:hypothetical protein FZEAL_4081 [Fusarium zealandicum]